MKKQSLKKSYKLWQEAQKIILDGTQLYSKSPRVYIEGVYPAYLVRGQGPYVWDIDGNKYLDYVMGLGTYPLGYSFHAVNQAVIKQVKQGSNFSTTHPLELKVAKLLHQLIPSAGMMRFLKTGGSATTAAIRIARAYTNRELVLKGEYHGWHDWGMAASKRNAGIPKSLGKLVKYVEWGELKSYQKLFKKYPRQIAAVITEPHIDSTWPKTKITNYLKELRRLCHQHDALLIFDEIVTGFRYASGGAQEYYEVTPDLSCFGKAIANGYPLSAVVGKKKILKKVQNKIFISITFGGEAVTLAAAAENLKIIRDQKVIKHIWDYGQKLRDETQKLIKKHGVEIDIVGVPSRLNLKFHRTLNNNEKTLRAYFLQEAIKRGILLGWAIFPSFSHTPKDLQLTLKVFDQVLALYAKNSPKNLRPLLKGPLPKTVEVL